MSKYAGLFKNVSTSSEDDGEFSAPGNNPTVGEPVTSYTLLFVDDEDGVLKSLRRIFLEENYRILTASGGEEALEVMRREQVHLVLSDYRMPGMTGAQLLLKLKEKWPETIRIMLTGFADVQSIMGAVIEGAVYKFITKPWNDEDLRLTVSLALQQYALIQENIKLRELTKKQHAKISKYAKVLDDHKGILANYLLQAGQIKQEDLVRAFKEKEEGEFISETLVRLGVTNETIIVKVLQDRLQLEYVDLKEMDLVAAVVKFLPRDLCERNRIMPVKLNNNQLTIAMADPSDIDKIDNISMMVSQNVVPLIARSSDILAQIKRIYGDQHEEDIYGDIEVVTDLDLDPLDEIDIVIEEDDEQINIEELLGSTEVPPIIRIVNAIISEAIRYEASDIHIEPKTKCTVVRYRIDGMLHNKIKIPTDIHSATISRIKILAKMDIAERRHPQDGRITVKSGIRVVDMRVSSMPTINGEKITMRILDKNASVKRLEELGMQPGDLVKIKALIKKPQGIIISTGPTGSGKTTMLYSILSSMMDSTKNFQTIEDPVEYFLEEANQIFIKEKTGLTFSSVLRATMRQDPDIVLVGEIRDFETADVAFKAALTGHMVLTSLHTNSSISSITRLIDMGVRPYLLSSAIEGILAQRLVRKICKHCIQEVQPDAEILDLLKIPASSFNGIVYKGLGCDRCDQTGYSGRTGVFELFVLNDDFKHLISSNYKEAELSKMARTGGMCTLLDDGIEKVRQGITSLEEILRVIGSQNKSEKSCPNCEAMIDLTFLYCPYCGVFKNNICPNCMGPMEDDWKICPACGMRKDTIQPEEDGAEPTSFSSEELIKLWKEKQNRC